MRHDHTFLSASSSWSISDLLAIFRAKERMFTLPDQLKDVFVSQFEVHCHGFVIPSLMAKKRIENVYSLMINPIVMLHYPKSWGFAPKNQFLGKL